MIAPTMSPEELIALFAAKAAAPPPETSQALARHLQCKESIALARMVTEAINECRDVIGKKYGARYVPGSIRAYTNNNANAQEAHEQGRNGPDHQDEVQSGLAQFKQGRHPRHHENTRCHHGGSVDQS